MPIDWIFKILNKGEPFLRTKCGLFTVFLLFFYLLKNSIGIFILSSLVYFISWIYLSGRLFFSKKIKILLAIQCEEEVNRYYVQIEREIRSKISELGLSNIIKVVDMPKDIIFHDHTKAENYIKKRMIDLLVWGYTWIGKDNNLDVSEFRLRFSYLYQMLPDNTRKIFIKKIDDSIKGRYWKIFEQRSFSDTKVVSVNITEVSLFILGICLYIKGQIQKSIEIFEKLRLYSLTNDLKNFSDGEFLKKEVDSFLIDAYLFIIDQNRDKHTEEAREYCKKIFLIDPNNASAHLNMARLCWMLDRDLQEAETHTNLVNDPLIRPLTNYNYAFFAVIRKDPTNVLKFYQRIRSNPSQNVVDIVSFLQDEFRKDPNNILFHFALGYIKIYHQDVGLGIKELSEFIDKAHGIAEYGELVKNAEKLLHNRSKC